ncbi:MULTISPECIES: LLM class flavin-dependent oxidoreductase [Microbacterium]|uniref:LLM class flavin-dependent oxidoreductase n=1 Tax=Microbacterium wangchenii TaxID=2541726 RepID=A0ABX5SMP7_9MICO|nr:MULTISPECIES: LLM class flavin-dependent oxidoreductase [Microbacterium]MCK6066427.1 LLM class flavin-dependent oxidoreductase [Microbacterium sp. EYE_512]QBR87391.1 LLM class flavin-dependent oxidoreductase [Microbacterium wangchenii]TXK14713.1 LLM class flavin-dependent oxidoreductase [Microbacterium wangchenii]
MNRIGAIFTPYFPPEALRDAAQAAEESGVPELWLWEDCFRESAFATASAVLAWTTRMRVGIGVAPMPMRNVALTAMEIATVERMFPGRLIPGVGHGVQSWMGQIGARVASPLGLMREYVPALRSLLAGAETSASGRYVSLDRVRLDWPPADPPPVMVAGEGPKTVRLTGEVGDGTVLPAGSTPERVASTLALAREGRAAADRPGPHELVVFVEAAFDPRHAPPAASDPAASDSAPVDPADGAAPVAGAPEEVAAALEPYFTAGATRVILQPPLADRNLTEFLAGAGTVARLLQAA